MNSIVSRSAASNAIASLSSLKTGLQNVSSTIKAAGGIPILRMLKDGGWVYGPDNVEVEEGSLWAVNIYSLQHGWVSWTDNKGKASNEVVGEVMVPMTSPLPVETELRDTGWDWKQQLSVELQCLNGTDTGEVVHYKVTSTGGKNALKALIGAIMKQLDDNADRPIPVVSLEHDHYQHRVHGKTYVPTITVAKWVELTDDSPDVSDVEEKEEPKAKATSRRASVPTTKAKAKAKAKEEEEEEEELEELEEAPAPEEAAPRRRRRV